MTNELNLAAALATVGKTEEQLKAEREAAELAKKHAEWARLAEMATKADPACCQGRVSDGWRGRRCNNKAKYHREEHISRWENDSPLVTRHYCALHDEVTKNEKQQARWAEEKRQREAKWAYEERCRNRSALISKFIGNVTSERLKELLDAGVTLETLLAGGAR